MKDNKLIAEFMNHGFHDGRHRSFDELKYHESWDWLMPVADKCLTTDEAFVTEGQHYFVNDALLTCNIEVVYDRVVLFIKDYNFIKEHNNGKRI